MKALKQVVRYFCIRKLAQILYDCVECTYNHRAEIDWRTAEGLVDGFEYSMTSIAEAFVVKQISETTGKDGIGETVRFQFDFETFDRLCGRLCWDLLYQKSKKSLMPDAYPSIRFH